MRAKRRGKTRTKTLSARVTFLEQEREVLIGICAYLLKRVNEVDACARAEVRRLDKLIRTKA
jgi:hypothetical protein